MVRQENVDDILKGYDKSRITIATMGGHSALDICAGAKKLDFRTMVICQRGRDRIYNKYYKTRDGKGIVDEIILLDRFEDITREEVQEELRKINAIMVYSRYFWCYCNYKDIKENLKVPIFGTRGILRFEERDETGGQEELLEKAGIRTPRIFQYPKEIDRLVMVRAKEAQRDYERAYFFANCYEDYMQKSATLIERGIVTRDELSKATISEYVIGVALNISYFFSPVTQELEILGMDMRHQTNIDGLVHMPAYDQLEALKYIRPKFIEMCHTSCTIKESVLEKLFKMGEQLVDATKKENPPGLIGPFGLKVCITAGPPKEEIIVYDVSLRSPGSPGTAFTPHTQYFHRKPVSMGERIAMEIKQAAENNNLGKICT